MKLVFHIDYHTQWGETLHVCGDTAVLGNEDVCVSPVMRNMGGDRWALEIELPADVESFNYRYEVHHENGGVKKEWGTPHHVVRATGVTSMQMYDVWQMMPWDKAYYSKAFLDCITRRLQRNAQVVPVNGFITLQVEAPMVGKDQTLAIVGESEALGAWNPTKAKMLNDAMYPMWQVNLQAHEVPAGTQFKFVLLNTADCSLVCWESGENRLMQNVAMQSDQAVVVTEQPFRSSLAPWRGAGTAIPVFSLRSTEDFGVGDFLDLNAMVDWAAKTGQNFIQLLPINDTTMTGTWTDSYPYNANSTFALHPMYLRLEAMGILKDKKRMAHYRQIAQELNQLKEIDYERVNNTKNEYYAEIFAQEGKKTMASTEFKDFVKRNDYWLRNYAAFCVLRDMFGTPDFSMWGEYAAYTPEKVDKVFDEHKDAVDLVYYLQYHLDKQMNEVRQYAHSKGVAIKGDIPIGISRTSVDAWTDTRLFNMDCQAGAPPDDFSVLGQNWGFPTYNWEEMSRDGFAWWKARFRKMSEYFDAYRIDHVLGFFRIWQIPMDALHGLLGYFNPAMPYHPDEMRNNYDFWINPEVQAQPFIRDWFLGDFFGEYTEEAKARFLDPMGYGRYRLLPQFNTQRKVAAYFASLDTEDGANKEKNEKLCNALLGLLDDVLFIEDPIEKGKYHPRISAQFTYQYRALNDYEKSCFNRLYNDFYYRRHNDFWYGKAMWKLPPLIDATDMLVCAEDLGMIPACVPAVMDALGILALEIQRMPKDPKSEFGNTWTYPYMSVCTTSTHDMSGIREWWEEDRVKTEDYYHKVLHEAGNAPYFCEPWIARRIVDLHLKSPSMLCIIPLQDYLAMDGDLRRHDPREERINVPANPRHYWRYRMHLTLAELNDATHFNDILKDMVRTSGR